MVTMKEIADLANVSRGTVDRVLNNRGSVNPQTAEKVRQIARTLGYKPNRAGMALAAQKKKAADRRGSLRSGKPVFPAGAGGDHPESGGAGRL